MKIVWEKLKQKRWLLGFVGITALGLALLLQNSGLVFGSLSYTPGYFYAACRDDAGNQYVISDGRREFAKLDADGVARWIQRSVQGAEFTECTAAAADNAGNVYLHDIVWSASGLSIDGERILQYDASGHFIGLSYSVSYEPDTVFKPQIYGLSAPDGMVSFLEIAAGSYAVYEMSPDGIAKIRESGAAGQSIQDAAAMPGGGFACVTKQGEVLLIKEGNAATLFTSPAQTYFIPYKVACAKDGSVYFTDIGNNAIYQINQSGVSALITRETMENGFGVSLQDAVLTSISVNENNQMCVVFDHVFGTVELGTLKMNAEASYPFAPRYRIGSLAMPILAAFGAALLLLSIAALARDAAKWLAASRSKTAILVIGSIALTLVLTMPGLLGQVRQSLVDSKRNELFRIAASVAASTDPADVESVNYPADYAGAAHSRIREKVFQILPRSGLDSEIYCNLIKLKDERAYSFFYQDDSIGAYYPLYADEAESLKALYQTGEAQLDGGVDDATGSYIYVKVPIKNHGSVVGAVEAGMVLDAMNEQLDGIVQGVLINTILLVLVLVFLIQAGLAFLGDRHALRLARTSGEKPFPVDLLRICMLLCAFGYNMPSAFLPVFMERLYDPSLPFGVYAAGALPLTINVFLTGFSALFCAQLARRAGVRGTLFLGVLCVFAGDLITATAGSYWPAFSGLILNGFGVGILFATLFVSIAAAKPEEQGLGFSAYNGALMGGMICGTLVGATLAEKIGQQNVFFCTLILWGLLLGVFLTVGRYFGQPAAAKNPERKAWPRMSIAGYLFSPQVLAFLLLVQLPFAAADGFTYYFVPVFGSAQGLNEQQVSLLLALNSLASVFVGDWLTEFTHRKYGRHAMYLASALVTAAMILFGISPAVATMVISILLIGIARSFGLPAQDTYICALPQTAHFGTEPALGIYNFLQNVGNSAGTSLFGLIAGLGFAGGPGFLTGFGLFAALGTVLTGLHRVLFERKEKNFDEK